MAVNFSKDSSSTIVHDMTTYSEDRTTADEEDRALLEHSEPSLRHNAKRRHGICRKIHLLILCATNFILLAFVLRDNVHRPERNIYEQNSEFHQAIIRFRLLMESEAPLWDLVEHETVVFLDNIYEVSPFQGPPDDINDELWDNLYRNSATILEADRAKRLPNRTTVAPGTQNDGVVSLEFFHQLHYLNAVRKSLYPERFPDYGVFFPDGTRNLNQSIHNDWQDHCVDRIRQAIMCDTNLGASLWHWNATMGKWNINKRFTQTCRNFEKIGLWTAERSLLDWDPTVPGRLTGA
ncbi:hypothetical protein PWT90_04944 [Aphanocladium album]|nr:hypothetical protein PWT90_04944 [Aphanocladium album]